MELDGKTVLITGGSAGLGFSLARAFADWGSKVLICGRSKDRLVRAQQECPGIEYLICDVTRQKEREALFDWASGLNVDILINNAGIQRDVDFTRGMEDLAGESELKINIEAPVYLSALFVPYFMGKDEETLIANITSGLAFVPSPRATVPLYIASKVFIHSFTDSLRRQLADTKVNVVEIVAPIMDTEINPEGRLKRKMPVFKVKPGEFALTILKGMVKGQQMIVSSPEHYPEPLELLTNTR